VEQLADVDSQLADKIIENESVELVTNNEIHAAMRRATMSNLAVPVLLGSSYKNIGVQPLMDSILR
jgi:elongation factor G